MAARKKTTLLGLVGKQVVVRGRYDSDFSGPVTLTAIELPFICVEHNGEPSWWNVNVIEGIREAKAEDAEGAETNDVP